MFGKEAYIVLEGINPAIQKMMEMLKEDERLAKKVHFAGACDRC